jgi:hypothetical protein
MNLVITISLLAIGLALIIGYAWGFRKGKEDEQQELERKSSSLATRQRREALEFDF